jgi:fructokinase
MLKKEYRLGIDLGGTKIEITAMDTSGQLVLRQRIPTPANHYPTLLDALSQLVEHTERELGVENCPLGIGIPGAISPSSGLIKNANTTCLIGHALHLDLGARLQRTVKLENDANCFALSEAMDGAGAGFQSVFAVILGTGVGGGIVINGRLLNGPNAISGEWGHNPLPWPQTADQPAQRCYCGKQGCLETYLSGPGFARQTQLQFNLNGNSRELLAQQAAGDAVAQQAYVAYVDRLARGLASVINILDPQVIVLGGGMSNIDSLYQDVPARWGQYVFSDTVNTRLHKNQHGDSSGVRGAAWLN